MPCAQDKTTKMSSPIVLNPQILRPAVQAALRAWHTVGGSPDTLLENLLLVRTRRAELESDSNPAAQRRATNDVLLAAIDELETQDRPGATVLRMRFLDADKALRVASRMNLSRDSVNRIQGKAIERLTTILWGLELALREQQALSLEGRLQPSQYNELFGLEQASAQLIHQLLEPQAPWVVAVTGIGGIGKTALADSAARQIIRQFRFERVIWLRTEPGRSNQPTTTPALVFDTVVTQLVEILWPPVVDNGSPAERLTRVRQALKAQPHLIIIDNLETEADTVYLVEHLNNLAAPSKFLLTARARLPGQAAAFAIPLDELSPADAFALLRQHAAVIGQNDLASISTTRMKAIYRVVGGNPLAIKLVVGLATTQPMPQILADLKRSRPGQVEDLYRHIYWRAWRALSSEARALLQAMPLVAEPGALPQHLRAISRLSEDKLWPAINELATRSLLEVRGTAWERRYGIHRLTETFLQTEIIHWPDETL